MSPIDYAAARREMPGLKSALTRAIRSGDPLKVLGAVEKAYERFDSWGAFPDSWHAWNIAALDAYMAYRRDEPTFADGAEYYELDAEWRANCARFEAIRGRGW